MHVNVPVDDEDDLHSPVDELEDLQVSWRMSWLGDTENLESWKHCQVKDYGWSIRHYDPSNFWIKFFRYLLFKQNKRRHKPILLLLYENILRIKKCVSSVQSVIFRVVKTKLWVSYLKLKFF